MHSIATPDGDDLFGFDREQLLMLSMEAREVRLRCLGFRVSRQRNTEVKSAAALSDPSALLSGSKPDSGLTMMTIRS